MTVVNLRNLTVLAVVLIVMGLLLPPTVMAQSTTEGAIIGTVVDPQGAVVPNATVTVRNPGTNAEQTLTTDGSGFFRATRLQPATYEVTVKAQGFAAYKATNVVVNIGTSTELSPSLRPGGATETVEVKTEAPQVNTTSSEFAPVVGESQIQNLPINGNRWSNFVMLTPAVVSDSSGFGLVSVRGMSTLQNNNTVDGADNNQAFFAEERGRTRAGYSTAKAAIQEFQVNTSGYSAEYGRAAGGVFNVVTRSGGNAYHGEAYFYDRDNQWGAMNAFTTITTKDASTGLFTAKPLKPKDWRKIAGMAIGGPIVKDKLFFYFTYDYFHRNFPGTSVAFNPGAFFATPTCLGTPADPTGLCSATSSIGVLSTRVYGANTLANNALAKTLYDSEMTKLLATSGPTPREGEQMIFFPKIDWQINGKNHLSFVVNRMRWASPAGIQTQATNTNGIASFGNDYVKVTWGTVKLNTTVTNNVVNEFRSQYGRDFEFQTPQTPTAYEQANLVSSRLNSTYTNPNGLPPELTISNGWNLGVANFLTRPKYPDERRQQYADTISISHGKHLLKMGADFTHVNDDTANLRFQFGSFAYSGGTAIADYFSDLNVANSCKTGTAVARPCYASLNLGQGPLGYKLNTNEYGVFIQDDWRMLPRLTMSLGLRWDYEKSPQPFPNLINPAVPQTAALPSDKNNFGPRVGFAWDMFGDGKTSIRGGYSIVYGRVINSTLYNGLVNTGMTGGQFQYTFAMNNASQAACVQAFPQIYSPSQFSGLSATCQNVGKAIVYFQNDFQLPKVHQVDVSFEREVMRDTVLQLSYLGAYGRNLVTFNDRNIAPSTKNMTYTYVGGPQDGKTLTVPLYTARLNSSFSTMTEAASQSDSRYDALVVQLNRRMNRHVQFNSNFTWSHAIDFGQNNTTFSTANGVLDPYNLAAEKGNSNQNVPMRFVFNAIAESPWKVNGWLGQIANGWQMAPLYQWQNGLPYSARISGSVTGALSGAINGANGDFRVFGTRNQFRQPDTHVVDLKFSKLIKFSERYSAELSSEFFNMLNHQNVTAVDTTAYNLSGSATTGVGTLTYRKNNTTGLNTFGTVTNTNSNFAYSPRQIQLGVRFKF